MGNGSYRDIVYQIWDHVRKAAIDLFATRENAQCPPFFFMNDQDVSGRADVSGRTGSTNSDQGETTGAVTHSDSPELAKKQWVKETVQLLCGQPTAQRSPITSARRNFLPSSKVSSSLGLAHERSNLTTELLDKGKASSTIKVYLAAISSCHVGFDGTTVGYAIL
ncbi:hypothetical protein MHYP_G00278840 [Metynnis hypsauchen]